MILHFLTDDKFCAYVLRQFSNEDSRFVLVSDSDELRFLARREGIFVVSPESEEFRVVVQELSKYRAVVFHGLFWPWQEFVLRNLPDHIKVAWMFWGGEIYGRSDLQLSFLAPRTKLICICKRLKSFLKSKGWIVHKYEIPKDLFSRIDYCLTDIPNEYSYASHYLRIEMMHIWYNYYSIEDTLGSLIGTSVNGSNILIGNSAAIEGNHLDAFDSLSRFDLHGRKIVVPLSYGEPWVANIVEKRGNKLFEDGFMPLTSFLPLNEYNKILSSCSIVVMNHYRPQAFGNIITSLWLGARVYMSEQSIQFKYLVDIGIKLFSIENDLKHISILPSSPLPKSDIIHNRKILYSLYCKDSISSSVSDIVSRIN